MDSCSLFEGDHGAHCHRQISLPQLVGVFVVEVNIAAIEEVLETGPTGPV
jgi:hypothetical protein